MGYVDCTVTVCCYTISDSSVRYTNCSGISFYQAGKRLFCGVWLTDGEYAERQSAMRMECVWRWKRQQLRPKSERCDIRERYSIRQPVWSHRRRESITSKTRQV